MRARRRGIAVTDFRYSHQRQGYAEAMQAWLEQVVDCHAGDNRPCGAPTPDPAAFYRWARRFSGAPLRVRQWERFTRRGRP